MQEKLKILVLTSLFPPYYVGGYELGCGDVVAGLRERGHAVTVLTSTYGVEQAQRDDFVYRVLDVDIRPVLQDTFAHQQHLYQRELTNITATVEIVKTINPDIVYVWSIHNASLSCVRVLQRAGYRTAFFISDLWPFRSPAWDAFYYFPSHPLRFLYRCWLGLKLWRSTGVREKLPLTLTHVQFASGFLAQTIQAVKSVKQAIVIHWGVDGSRFLVERQPDRVRHRLLFVGQVVQHKGIDTLIEVVGVLHNAYGYTDLCLTVAGICLSETYLAELQAQTEDLGIRHAVDWLGMLPREQLPALYAEHDILVFPSRWDEPFSITVVEALAAGLVVIASATGGTPEIIQHEKTGLLFERDDVEGCAEQIIRVLSDPDLAYRLRTTGQQIVQTEYQMTTMVAKIEADLIAALR